MQSGACEGSAYFLTRVATNIEGPGSAWAVKAKLPLGEREYTCEGCDLVIGRDHNAAINLARWTSQSATAGTHSVAGRGGAVRPSRQNIDEPAHPVESSTETPILVGV